VKRKQLLRGGNRIHRKNGGNVWIRIETSLLSIHPSILLECNCAAVSSSWSKFVCPSVIVVEHRIDIEVRQGLVGARLWKKWICGLTVNLKN
jgi:hypothetical protein